MSDTLRVAWGDRSLRTRQEACAVGVRVRDGAAWQRRQQRVHTAGGENEWKIAALVVGESHQCPGPCLGVPPDCPSHLAHGLLLPGSPKVLMCHSRGMRRASTTCGGAGGRREMAFLVAPDLKATRCVLAPVGPPAPCPGEGVGGLGAWGAEGSEGATDKPPERGRTIHSAAGRGRPPTTSSISGAQREAACLCVFFHESLLTTQSHRGL